MSVVDMALLLIDLQNDYFVDGELARCRDDLLAACNRLVERARGAGVLVVEIQTVHAHDKSTWALNMLEDDQGMALAGTHGAERLAGLLEPDLVVVKTRDSAFHDTDLAELLASHGVHRLVLTGVSTESCVAATAIDAYARDLQATLVRDATASVDEALHEGVLERLHAQYRQTVAWADQVAFE
jgi:nicotinamidase-related amidase